MTQHKLLKIIEDEVEDHLGPDANPTRKRMYMKMVLDMMSKK